MWLQKTNKKKAASKEATMEVDSQGNFGFWKLLGVFLLFAAVFLFCSSISFICNIVSFCLQHCFLQPCLFLFAAVFLLFAPVFFIYSIVSFCFQQCFFYFSFCWEFLFCLHSYFVAGLRHSRFCSANMMQSNMWNIIIFYCNINSFWKNFG